MTAGRGAAWLRTCFGSRGPCRRKSHDFRRMKVPLNAVYPPHRTSRHGSQPLSPPRPRLHSDDRGTWRSLVAHLLWEQGALPTKVSRLSSDEGAVERRLPTAPDKPTRLSAIEPTATAS